MKLMVIKAVENRSERDVLLNPATIESIEAAEAMSRITTASGRAHYTETNIGDLYTMWMMALNPDIEFGYSAGAANMKAQYERLAAEQEKQAKTEQEASDGADG